MIEENYLVNKGKAKTYSIFVALTLVLAGAIISGTMIQPYQMANAQNVTVQEGNTTSNATTVNASAIDQVDTSVLQNLAAPGWANKYDVNVGGKPTPLNYNIIGGQLVGMLANPQRHAVYLALNPQSGDGGAVELQLPRNLIDSKTSNNTDKPYVVVMDGDRIGGDPGGICLGDCPNIFNTFKQTSQSNQDRVLTIVFGPESRFVEVIGSKGM